MKRMLPGLTIAFVWASTGWAQMMGGGSGTYSGSGPYMEMFQAMSSSGAIGSGMGIGMTEDLAVDTDGTAYVVRAVASTQTPGTTAPTATWQYELAAVSPADGSLLWKLTIPGGRVSHPRLGSDGRIFLTVDNYQMFYANYLSGGMMMSGSQVQANDGQLVIVTHTSSSASIQATVQTVSDVLSAPRIVTDSGTGNYLVYVMGYDMMSWTQGSGNVSGSFAPGNKVLYAYKPDGTLKFSVQLAQASAAMMP
ncbi:MAG: hypothetical protein J0H49_00060 [Acidobacteria bacterium]|nr:hypothetical protein [Acidobacteriota bacterium]